MNKLRNRLATLVFCLLGPMTLAHAAAGLENLDELPPGEQYRQLSLIVLIARGADPALMDAIAPRDAGGGGRASLGLGPDDYKTPLIRIVDQQSMLSGAAFLLRYAQESKDEIQASLAALNASYPVLISMADMNAITEDAIIIRSAIADAISYSELANDGDSAVHLQAYREQTIHIRNVMEYEAFDEELQRLTDEAIASVGGKLDAYQRMFDEEVGAKELDRQFDAAKYIFNRTEKFDEEAGLLTEEIMKNVIYSQSIPIDP